MKVSRRISASLAAGLAVATVLFGGGAAQAAIPADPTQIDILVFENATVSDIGQEVALVSAALTPIGGVVTTFDGGDGSDLAWTTALAGIDVLLLPELEAGGPFYEVGGTPLVSDAAAAVIAAWVQAGGVVIMNGACPCFSPDYAQILGVITGKDFGLEFVESSDFSLVWDLQSPISGAPGQLLYSDGTYGLPYGAWPADLKSIVAPIYLTADGQDLAVGNFSAGSGYVTYFGYDWYPNGEPSIADWETALRLAATGALVAPFPAVVPAAAPALAATGVSLELPVIIASLMLLVGAAFVLVSRRRRTA
jgi:hypothetical protein